MDETTKRLNIAEKVGKNIHNATAIYLAGSMGFGQHYSVSHRSDIDMVVIADAPDKRLPPEKQLHATEYAIKTRGFDRRNCMLRSKLEVMDVAVNVLVYDRIPYERFVTLADRLYTQKDKYNCKTTIEGYGFGGKKLTGDRYCYTRSNHIPGMPRFIDGRFYGTVPRQDFLFSMYPLQGAEYLDALAEKVWEQTVARLFWEYRDDDGNLDIKRFNLLNTHWTVRNQPGRVPDSVKQRIVDKTLEWAERLK